MENRVRGFIPWTMYNILIGVGDKGHSKVESSAVGGIGDSLVFVIKTSDYEETKISYKIPGNKSKKPTI